jgi:integrase
MGVQQIQQFATDLQKTVPSSKTIENILGTIFAILDYARKCEMKVPKVGFADLTLGNTIATVAPFFTKAEALAIVEAAKEPFRSVFAIAWYTGCRAGEILALTLGDLDFDNKTIRVNKACDDATREVRPPKTKASIALLPMPSALEAMLRSYIQHWTPNPARILFPAPRNKQRSRSRDNCVRVGLKPILRQLGIPYRNTGLHAFRHGLSTALAERSTPIKILQNQMRHSDVRTTLKIYSHVIPQSHRDAMETVGPISTSISTVLQFARK